MAPRPCEAQIAAPSQVTPQNLRPPDRDQGQGISVSSDTALSPPPGADQLHVLLRDVRIEGAFADLSKQAEALLDDVRGRRVSVARIYELARSLERLHVRAGYALARVIVPPQNIADGGQLLIVVVDGFIEEVDASAIPERVRSVVLARVNALVKRRHIKLVDIERALLIAGEVPGLNLRSAMVPGNSRGGTRLLLEGEHRLLSGSTTGDDRLPGSLGTWQLRGSVAANGAFGLGEQIYATAGSSVNLRGNADGSAPLSVYGGGAIVPIGNDGLAVNPEYTHSVTRTAPLPGVPASMGTFDRFSLRLRDPVIRTRQTSLNIGASIEYISQQVGAPAFNVLLSNDRYAVIRMGPDYLTSLPWGGALQAGGSISGGIGGRSDADVLLSRVPLSRLGAGPNFLKLNGSLSVSQPLGNGFRLDVNSLAQLSMGTPMLRSEQFALDGTNAVSAFASGTINVDQGATLRGEFVRPIAVRSASMNAAVSPYVFVAIGHGELFCPTALERSVINVGALGIGTRGVIQPGISYPSLTIGIELARQFTDIPSLRQGWRSNVNASMEF